MMRGAVLASLCGVLAVVHAGLCATIQEKQGMGVGTDQLTFTIVYDNRSGSKGLESAWGFSCLVKGLDVTILFDTGGDSPTLLRNMAKLGIAPESVDVIVLSHAHMDHFRAAGTLHALYGVPVYAEPGADKAIRQRPANGSYHRVSRSQPIPATVGAIAIEPFTTRHAVWGGSVGGFP